jgi:hypothetical protein
MLPFEFIGNVLSLNLQWFVELVMGNLLWVFVFIMLTFINNEMKWSTKIFFVALFYVWTTITLIPALGLVFLVGGFLFFTYITRVVAIIFTENIPSLKDRLPLVLALQFIGSLIYYNLFMV